MPQFYERVCPISVPIGKRQNKMLSSIPAREQSPYESQENTGPRERHTVFSDTPRGRAENPFDLLHVLAQKQPGLSRQAGAEDRSGPARYRDRKSTRLNSSHSQISY